MHCQLGINSLPFCILGEYDETNFLFSANWVFNFMVVMITPVAFDSIGYKTYIIFAVM